MDPETKLSPMADTKFAHKIKKYSLIVFHFFAQRTLLTLRHFEFISNHNVLEAVMVGTMDGLPICVATVAKLIVFLSIYNFFNQILCWVLKATEKWALKVLADGFA
ncbi:hypothetical protein ACTXT7_014454 [Hymenolepis weldensis]